MAARKRKTTGIRRKRPSSARIPVSAEAGDDQSPDGVAAGEAPASRAGQGIGELRRQGMGITAKLVIPIAVLLAVLMAILTGVAASHLRSSMYDEIMRRGVDAAVMLHRIGKGLAPGYLEVLGTPRQDEWQPGKMLEDISLRYLKGNRTKPNHEIVDAVIMYHPGKRNHPVAYARDRMVTEIAFAPQVFLEGYRGLTTEIRRTTATIQTKRGIKKIPVFEFKHPFTVRGSKFTARLLVSSQAVDDRVGSVRSLMLLIGALVLVLAVVGVYFLSQGITMPIHALVRDMDIVSQGDLTHVARARSRDEVGLLATAFGNMTQSLAAARVVALEAERMEGELSTARDIQAGLLPSKMPQLPGYEIFPYYRSAKEVGGDYYDFFPVDREHIGIIVADVSGKGIPGAMVMSQTRTTVRLLAPGELSAKSTLSKTNAVIAREIKRGMFVTCIYLILHLRSRRLNVVSAGHNPMVLWRQKTNKVELINPNGIALGFDKGPIFDRTMQEQQVQLQRGDRFVIYTDGVVEAMSPDYEEYGEERYFTFCRDHAQSSSKDFVLASVKDLDLHKGDAEQHDDITIVTFRVL